MQNHRQPLLKEAAGAGGAQRGRQWLGQGNRSADVEQDRGVSQAVPGRCPDNPGIASEFGLGIDPGTRQPVKRVPPPEQAGDQLEAADPVIAAAEVCELVRQDSPPLRGRQILDQPLRQEEARAPEDTRASGSPARERQPAPEPRPRAAGQSCRLRRSAHPGPTPLPRAHGESG